MGVLFIPALETAAGWTASEIVVWGIVRTIVVNIALGYLSKVLSPASRKYAPPVNVTIRSSTENRRLIFGKARASGVIVSYALTGGNGQYLSYIVAYAGHQVSAISDVWLDNLQIKNAYIDGSTGAVTGTRVAGKCYIWKYLGTSTQAADPYLISVVGWSAWSSAFHLYGIAYIHLRMERDDTAYPSGAPQNVTAIVSGALMYDPRLDSTNGGSGTQRSSNPSTWAFSRNPALVARWFLTGGAVTNDVTTRQIMYGLREIDSRILDSYTIAAANRCDETLTGSYAPPDGDSIRYSCDLEVSTGETREDILTAIFATMAGGAPYVKGQWRIFAGGIDTPSTSISMADIFSDIEVQDTTEHAQRYNAVTAVFRDAANSYSEQTSPVITTTAAQTQDGGELISKEIDLRGVTNRWTAQRLCTYEQRKSRAMRQLIFSGSLALMDVASNETFTITSAPFGWSGVTYRLIQRDFDFSANGEGQVKLTAQIEPSTIWTELGTSDYITPNSADGGIQTGAPDAPGSPVTSSQLDSILVSWAPVAGMKLGLLYSLEEANNAAMTGAVEVYRGAAPSVMLAKIVTTTFYYRVRSFQNGIYSGYVPSTGGISGRALAISNALAASVSPTTASSTSSSTSQTTNSVSVSVSGGTSPYTYAWTITTSSGTVTIGSSTAATTTFSAASLALGETRTANAHCVVTDNVGATFALDVAVTITRPAAMTATAAIASPGSGFQSANATNITSQNLTATPTGGTGPYTYLWSIVSEDQPSGSPTFTASTSATTKVTSSANPALDITVTTVVQCVVTDSVGSTATTNTLTLHQEHTSGGP